MRDFLSNWDSEGTIAVSRDVPIALTVMAAGGGGYVGCSSVLFIPDVNRSGWKTRVWEHYVFCRLE